MRKRKEVLRSFNYSEIWVVNVGDRNGGKEKMRGFKKDLEWKRLGKKGAEKGLENFGRFCDVDPYFYAQNFERIKKVGLPIERKSSEIEIKNGEWIFGYCSESLALMTIRL